MGPDLSGPVKQKVVATTVIGTKIKKKNRSKVSFDFNKSSRPCLSAFRFTMDNFLGLLSYCTFCST